MAPSLGAKWRADADLVGVQLPWESIPSEKRPKYVPLPDADV